MKRINIEIGMSESIRNVQRMEVIKMANTPLYKKVMQDLEIKIAKGKWQSGEKLPTETELEAYFSVSNITIRHALKGLVEKGLIVRKRGGGSYVKEISAASPAPDGDLSRRVIGLLMPTNRNNGDMMDIVCGVSKVCLERGYLMNVTNFGEDTLPEEKMLEKLIEKSSGVIYYPLFLFNSFECLYTVSRQNYPLVTLDQNMSDLGLPYVVSDNQSGEYEATKLLLKKGHEHICFVSVTNYATTVRDRFTAFCRAMEESGHLVTSENYIVSSCNDVQSKEEEHDRILSALLDRPNPITAVLAVNDYVAYELIKAAQRRNIKIPEDLSIIGYDNLPFIEQMNLPLMTVSQDLYTMGERAAELLIDRIEGRPAPSVTIPVKIVNRGSVQALNLNQKGNVSATGI